MREILIKLIMFFINLIEKIEFKNKDLDEHDDTKKIAKSIRLNALVDVLADTGYEPIEEIHLTQPYTEWKITTYDKTLYCADNHRVFDINFKPIYVKDLYIGDVILTKDGMERVESVQKMDRKYAMYDISVGNNKHRYYSNGILSHNTICSSIFIAWYVMFNFDKNILVLSNKGATTKEIVDKIRTMLDNLPFFMKPGLLKNDVTNLKFDNGSRIISQSTTPNAGIGLTIHLLFLDEFAHIHRNFVNPFYENVYPTMSANKNFRIIITSTPNGYNKFEQIYTGAVKGKNEYAPFRIDWWQVPGRDKAWMKREIGNLGSEDAFNRQYGNEFMSGDNLLLGPSEIKKLKEFQKNFEIREIDDLEFSDVPYRSFLKWAPDFDIDEAVEDDSRYWAFGVDIGEGGNNDQSVIHVFEIQILEESEFGDLIQPGSFIEFYGLRQVGIFVSNEHSIEEMSKVLYTLAFDVFNPENSKIVMEWNTFGGELLKNLETIFPQRNEFDEEVVVKFKHRNDAKLSKFGLRVKMDNKPILCEKFKKYVKEGRIKLYEEKTIDEVKSFGRSPSGKYEGQGEKDDIAMAAIMMGEFLSTLDFSDFVEEIHETKLNEQYDEQIDKIIEKGSKGDGNLYYDIYELLK